MCTSTRYLKLKASDPGACTHACGMPSSCLVEIFVYVHDDVYCVLHRCLMMLVSPGQGSCGAVPRVHHERCAERHLCGV